MEAISAHTLSVVEDNSVTMEFNVAVDSNGHTWKDPHFVFTSPLTDLPRELNFTACSPDFPQHYCHTIESVDRTHEGVYTATAASMLLTIMF